MATATCATGLSTWSISATRTTPPQILMGAVRLEGLVVLDDLHHTDADQIRAKLGS
jgi:hypothetical protein